MIEIEYTIEEGGKWVRANLMSVQSKMTRTTEEAEDAFEFLIGALKPEIQSRRRVAIMLEGGNSVEAAAVRLPNGRVFDAILGCFRDDEEAIKRAGENWEIDFPPATRQRVQAAERLSNCVREYLDGNGPDPMKMATAKQRRKRMLEAYQGQIDHRKGAIRRAFERLYEKGEIETPPEEIPERAPNGLEAFAAELPEDVFWFIRSGRLVTLVQEGMHAGPRVLERGYVCLDLEGPPYEIPPEDPLATWEIPLPDLKN